MEELFIVTLQLKIQIWAMWRKKWGKADSSKWVSEAKKFKILFVFKKEAGDPILLHYSVLYPAGTTNYISGDKGSQW